MTVSWVERFTSQNMIWPGLRQGKVLDYVLVDEPMQDHDMTSWAYPMPMPMPVRKGVA